MRIKELTEQLQYLLPADQPVWIHGPPGIGKTAAVHAAAEALGYEVPAFPPAVTLDPVDLRGIPTIDNGRTIWTVPDFWPTDPDWKGVIFVDELPQAPPMIQSCFMQLTCGGKLGSYVKPKGAAFVVCGNRREDRAGTQTVITPLLNRFLHIDLDVNNEDWQTWALNAGIAPEVRANLNYRPGQLYDFDPARGERSFATPRSWEMVSRVVQSGMPDHLLLDAVAGCVGKGPAAEFVGFRQIYHDLPDPLETIHNPDDAEVPTEPAVLYALAGALVERLRQDKSLAENFMRYASRMQAEFATLMVRDGYVIEKKLFKTPSGKKWLGDNKQFMLEALAA